MQAVAYDVTLRSGRPCTFRSGHLSGFFESVMQLVVDADRSSPCPLSNSEAVALEVDREVCFVAGQLRARGVPVDADGLRSELVCWLEERTAGASSAAVNARAATA